MNILIPHSWLLEHLDTKAKPTEIQKYLSLCGPSIERIYEKEGESVYDIEVTTNRVDSMSVRGIAREAAVILPQFGIEARLKPAKHIVDALEKAVKGLPVPAIIDDKHLSRRIICVVLNHVEHTPTPAWMAKRLRQLDMNVHDAVIDITNYITHELGHPCHAFDYDSIMDLGGMIIIKEASAGKKFTTLDDKTYTTVGGEVVFENGEGKIIDLPGIKGTANTAVTNKTKRVLFFIESVVPKKIRFASMTHAIRTVAAQLNEKNVDPNLAKDVIEYGTELFINLAHAQVASPLYDSFPNPAKPKEVVLPLSRLEEYLGLELPVGQVGEILEKLGCDVQLKGGKKKTDSAQLTVTPPTYRPDLQIAADIIEEVARIYGYHNLPSVVMDTAIPLEKQAGVNFSIEQKIKRFLANIGWFEVYTYSMVSEALALESGYGVEEHLKIQNPLTDDRVYMRRSLIPSLREVLKTNPSFTNVRVFEVANIYPPVKGKLPDEKLHLTLLTARPYRELKGELEALLGQLFIKNLEVETVKTEPGYAQTASVSAWSGSEKKTVVIGKIGVLEDGLATADLEMPALLKVVGTHPSYQPQPKTSVIKEDLTFTLMDKTEVGPMMAAMKELSPVLKEVTYLDQYQQNVTFSFAYSDPAKHLTQTDVSALRKEIVELLAKHWNAKLVGSLT